MKVGKWMDDKLDRLETRLDRFVIFIVIEFSDCFTLR
jgi:hypothetical protein